MAYVTEADQDSAPTVLIVDNNPMSTRRLSEVFRIKDFHIDVCEDGDQAVDEYIRLDPELVVIALDTPRTHAMVSFQSISVGSSSSGLARATGRRLAWTRLFKKCIHTWTDRPRRRKQ